ncbi:MAG: murein transglycosylase A [Sphingomonadales bacterium]|nr:murein transglycosylase A [Sphingomonadales bacterium]MBD3772934.1 murein transglycosylase A [Paracoccaceae bacterium]
MRHGVRLAGILAGLVLLAGCVRLVPEGSKPAAPVDKAPGVSTALFAGVRLGPTVASLGMGADDAGAALSSFVESCPRLLTRTDSSGLTTPESWREACDDARSWPYGKARAFFDKHFETAQVGDGGAFATGYFEPEIAGVRTRQPGFDYPVYKMPPELVRGWPDDMPQAERTGRQPLGRYDAAGKFVPYYTRGEIEDGAIANRGLEIAWVADPVEFFFLQIQGSGRLRAPDGSVMRIGYAGQNGREYVGIGSVMRERGLLGTGPGQYPGSMQGIMAYLREHPADGDALMRMNQSWVFFSELKGDGPLGALGVPVRRQSSVAADPNFVPLGAPVWLAMDRPEAGGLWIAQDTGGAIKGANRFDTFWGAGEDARTIAGGMSARGQALLLLPKGTVERLRNRR